MKHILFISALATNGWGGSEELWTLTALALRREGYKISADVVSSLSNKRLIDLERAGVNIHRRSPLSFRVKQLAEVIYRDNGERPLGLLRAAAIKWLLSAAWYAYVDRLRPDLVVISQSDNYNGWDWMHLCFRTRIPYITIAHSASETSWPTLGLARVIAPVYRSALRKYFVSRRNLELTRLQILDPLEGAEIVRNPFNVPYDPGSVSPMPSTDSVKLACIGRIHPPSKGHDLICQVMALDKWRARPVEVTFYGSGVHSSAVEKMIEMLELKSVKIAGFSTDIQAIWRESHALLLPSRYEGLPIVIVEAMLCGRIPIVTDVAGNAEVVEDGVTGFIAAAPTLAAVDRALEEAWQRRAEWADIGARAASRIRELIPADPAVDFACKIAQIMDNLEIAQGTRQSLLENYAQSDQD